jgi:hypothetical protein
MDRVTLDTKPFTWNLDAFHSCSLDNDSRAMAYFVGLPKAFGLQFVEPSELGADDLSQFTIFAVHRPVFYRLGIALDGHISTIGPGERLVFVNSSLGRFGMSLYAVLAFKQTLDKVEKQGDLAEFRRLGAVLETELRRIDSNALEGGTNWWPTILCDY